MTNIKDFIKTEIVETITCQKCKGEDTIHYPHIAMDLQISSITTPIHQSKKGHVISYKQESNHHGGPNALEKSTQQVPSVMDSQDIFG